MKFKYFSRSMDSFQGLFKTNFVFKDFSRLPFIFKYFSSLCEPCRLVVLVCDTPIQCPLQLDQVSRKYLKGLWPAQNFITMGDNSRTQSELSFLYATCLLNVLYLMVKYHEISLRVLEFWAAQDLKTMGGNSKTESARVVSLARDRPRGRPLHP